MKWKNIFPIIGISIFIYLIYKIGLSNIFLSFQNIKLVPFLIFISLIIPEIFLLNLKWAFILKKQGIVLPLFYLFKIYMIGLFYGVITPAKAGSLIRAFYIKKRINKSLVEISISIVVERALDLISILFLSILGALFLFNNIHGLTIKLLISFLIIVGLCLFFFNKRRSQFVFSLIFKYILPRSIKEKIDSSFSSFYNNLPTPKNLFIFTLITIFTWIAIATQAFFAMQAFSINVPYLSMITIFLIATAVGIIPITVNGLGTREATLIGLFSLFNVQAANVISASIMMLILGSLIPAFIGFLLSLKEEKIQKNEILNNNSTSSK